ncbi:MAG TPA: zinc ribbon domain-containing protein [Bryobacteraceae bacterium]|nr:zinc ribbon domain-containing protein [Bryobacteraceae bacterium]
MSSMIRFTENYDDLSTDRGYQFKFFCDRCRNGYMSSFQTSVTGVAGGLLQAAGSIFGGVLSRAGHGAYEIQRAVGGQAHDRALRAAVEEVKPHFHQCKRCGKWVCPEVCWNVRRGLCMECAPDVEQEIAAAQAQATKDQVWQKAADTDYTEKLDLKREMVAYCPECGAKTQGGKFCPVCGNKLNAKTACPQCDTEVEAGTKFCPECGGRIA